MISVFKVNEDETGVTALNILLGPKEPELSAEAQECKKKDEVESLVLTGGEGMDDKEIQKLMREKGCKAYERYYTQRVAWERAQFKKAYIVTTRRTPGEPFQIIGLLVQQTSESYYGIKDDLDPPTNIFLANELQSKSLDEPVLVNAVVKKGREVLGGTAAANLLEYLDNQLVQGNYENVTPEAQGIGEEGIHFARQEYGKITAVGEDDVQTYIRVSEGLPQNYENNNEVIVSLADGISYRRYERKPISTGMAGGEEIDSTVPTNAALPLYGAELRYGLEAINYPSLWSERLTLNALWGSSRLGIILPTSGWAGLATSFGNTRTMTHGGLGVNGAFDFPIKVISESGVFNLSTSFVFDDAVKSEHMRMNDEMIPGRWEDYLVRYHGAVHYSFAVKIDKDFIFRMRLGGTVYGMETWADETTVSEDPVIPDTTTTFKKVKSENIGGISGRVDFMTTSWSTPIGFSISYFDESLLSLAWLQIPVMPTFAIRIDAQVFAPILRDPRPWETSAVVIPSMRFIFNF
jgi:hypothetical protein